MEPVYSLPCSQVPAIVPYPEPDQSIHIQQLISFKIRFNIILQYTPWYPKWSLSFRFSD